MSERYSRLFSLIENLYAEGAPVIISAGALLKDNQTGKVLAQLKFTNIQEKQIKALKVKIYQKDTVGNALGEPIEYQYLDLTAKRDSEFASNVPIILSDAATRSFDVEVTETIFTDNSIWNSGNFVWEKLPNKLLALDKIKDAELLKQYQIAFGLERKYAYSETKDLWYCACGAVNKKGEHTCHSCKISAEVLTNMDLLKENCEKRLADEARQAKLAAEKAAEETRQMEIQAKKTKKIAMIAAPILVAVIAFVVVLTTVIIPNSEYNAALALIEEQKYEEAAIIFDELGEYKDAEEKALEAKYCRAIQLDEQEDYEEAYNLFVELGDYKDSKEQSSNEKYQWYICKKGDIIIFGSYEQDNNTYSGKEPIEWVVLDKTEDKVLLISKYALDCKPFDNDEYAYTWENCFLRSWLKDSFFNTAFSYEEQTKILATMNENKDVYAPYLDGNPTEDKVFVLTVKEVEKYLDDDLKQAEATEFVRNISTAYIGDNGCAAWWTRNQHDEEKAIYVHVDGSTDNKVVVDNDQVCVRPAMWVSIEG